MERLFSLRRVALIGGAAILLAACQDAMIPKELQPVSYKLNGEMQQNGMKETSPIFVRIFKEESELEIWKQRPDGRYALLKTYDVCKWSGVLGPKLKEGDRQAPEGFYVVKPHQMNPKSQYYLSFNIGFPNNFDRAHGRTGSHLMVHGACSSSGCYSMTDQDAGQIFALARDAFKGGQTAFQIQAFPFRMTPENFARHRGDPNMEFWKMLKVGHDHFEVTRKVPKVDVCDKRYVFDADAGNARFSPTGACPRYKVPDSIATAVAQKQTADEAKMASAAADLDAAAARRASQEQKLAAERAAEAAEAAERAAQPTVVDRLLGRKTNAEPEPIPQAQSQPVEAKTETAKAPTPQSKPATVVTAPSAEEPETAVASIETTE
ncbi:MAG: murein L,D-transpeptidase, partial [Hyphomicrobiales bacterium]|nr:murein L,D-transpeptidase [Hyphomicrobiales bacterium]